MAKKKETATGGSRLNSAEFQALLKTLQKTHGESIVLKASDARANSAKRIPTNVFQLDYALGGGFTVGMIHTLYGPQSSMKTSLVLRAIGNAQKYCVDCWTAKELHDQQKECKEFRYCVTAYIDVEGTFDWEWAKTLGVDINPEYFILSQPSFGEQAVDIADALLRSGDIDIMVVDSIAFITPTKEIEKSAEGALMGNQAQLIGKLVRKTVTALNDLGNANGRRPTVFWINQIRQTMTMFGDPNVQPGGKAHPYAAATIVKLTATKAEFASGDDKAESPLFIPINFKIDKNKTGVPKMEGDFKLVVTDNNTKKKGEVYDEDRMSELAEKCGLYTKMDGSTKWLFDGELIGVGRKALEDRLCTDIVFKTKVKDKLIAKLTEKLQKTEITEDEEENFNG